MDLTATDFIARLIDNLTTMEGAAMSNAAARAYEETLAHYHPWLIRKAVGVAVYALPSRATLLVKMRVTEVEGS